MRRNVSRYVGVAVLFACITCGGLDTLTIEQTATTTVQGCTFVTCAVQSLPFGFGGFSQMHITDNQELKNQGVTKDQIDAVFVNSVTLTIQSGAQDFTFIDDIKFFATAAGQEKKLIASGGPFQANQNPVTLEVAIDPATGDRVDLAPYAVADAMDITAEANGTPPSQTTTIDARISLDVDVNVSGVLGCD